MKKSIWFAVLMLFGISMTFASGQVLDVVISEYSYQEVTYNPLVEASGIWADANEQQEFYSFIGTINITNTHATEPLENIILNFTQTPYIYNLTFTSGSTGIVIDYVDGQSYATLAVPDLGAGKSSVFTYYVNTTLFAPPLNMTTTYNDQKALAGDPIIVTDRLSSNVNATGPATCLHDILIVQNALALNNSGAGFLNTSFDSDIGVSGSDAANTTISADNMTLTWDVWGGGCLEPTDSTDITYTLNTPANIVTAADYPIINSTISYRLNTTTSGTKFSSVTAITDLELLFNKEIDSLHAGDNATWRVWGNVSSDIDITVNVTSVSFWVSTRNGGGGGFTNPSVLDNDTISGASLQRVYTPGILLNNSLPGWSNNGSEWFFNYTYTSSPIVWMDLEGNLFNDGVQITNRSISFGNNEIYTKEIYLVTGYWIEISRNITRVDDDDYSIFIKVVNRGNSATPANQVVVVYNFLMNTFNLTSAFDFSESDWYTTVETNATLNDPIYNGTMYQFALLPATNPYNSSLDLYGGAESVNNTWTVSYNVTGFGEFAFDDLFLTGVDPLQVKEIGSTQALTVENVFKVLSGSGEYLLVGVAALVGVMLFLF